MRSRTRPIPDERTPPFHALTVADVERELQSDLHRGLSSDEAARRLQTYGPNRLPEADAPKPWQLVLHQFASVLIYVLLGAAVVSLLLGDWLEFGAILVIAVLNAVLGFAQEYRAERALRALQEMSAPSASVVRDGRTLRLPAASVVPGDVLVLEAGDIVAADARVAEEVNLATSEALLTGESLPVEKDVEPVSETAYVAERASMVHQGTLVARGRGRAIAATTGSETQMGRIAALVAGRPREETHLQRELADVGRYLAYGAAGLCVIVFFVGLLRGIGVGEMALIAASLGVAAIPEGLPAASTIVLALGVQRMAARHVIVRRLASVETLGAVTTIFTDKTGTLTLNRMSVQDTWAAQDDDTLLRVAVLCNNATLGPDAAHDTGDPTEIALLRFAQDGGYDVSEARIAAKRDLELPFEAERARMTVVVDEPDGGRVALVKGAPEVIVERSIAIGTAAANEASKRDVLARSSRMAEDGMRVLALAQRHLTQAAYDEDLEQDLTLVGLVGLADPLRDEAPAAVQRARDAGIRVVMLTGDQPATAHSIGERLALDGAVITGREVEELGVDGLNAKLDGASIFARVTSDHKLAIVEAARRSGNVVAMTGDGVNDAPALRAADIGVAMGLGGTDVAREASDMVLTDDNFDSIIAAVEEGRTIHANVRRFILFLLSCNAAEVMVVFLALAVAGEAVLTPLQILFVNLVTDGLPALALGVEPAAADIMRRRPRDASKGLLTRASLPWITGMAVLIAASTLAAFAIGKAWDGDGLATRFAFATLVGSQLAASFVFRSDTLTTAHLQANVWLIGAVALSLLAMVLVFYAGPLQDAFDTGSLSIVQWGTVVALSLVPFIAGEAVKLRAASKAARGGSA